MAIQVELNGATRPQTPLYPCVRKGLITGMVVLFVNDKKAIVLEPGTSEHCLGDVATDLVPPSSGTTVWTIPSSVTIFNQE